jgi:hypothetical protein
VSLEEPGREGAEDMASHSEEVSVLGHDDDRAYCVKATSSCSSAHLNVLA